MQVVTVATMKQREEAANRVGVSYETMMEQAAAAAFARLQRENRVKNRKIAVLCGSGNNGGDAYELAERLLQNGARVWILPLKEPKSALCQKKAAACLAPRVEVQDFSAVQEALQEADVLIDGVFGTGFSGDIEGTIGEILRFASTQRGYKLALDIPSGIEADTGYVGQNAFHADLTMTFDAPKIAHFIDHSAALCGKIRVADIGIPKAVQDQFPGEGEVLDVGYVQKHLRPRLPFSYKGNYGRLLVLAGSLPYSGAAVMATRGALRTGTGLTTLATTRELCLSLAGSLPEAIKLPLLGDEEGYLLGEENTQRLTKAAQKNDAVLFGCGVGTPKGAEQLLRTLLKEAKGPILLDADGLNLLSQHIDYLTENHPPLLLTPHPGELARLLGMPLADVLPDAFTLARELARRWGVTLLLKGHNSVLFSPSGYFAFNIRSTPALAKGGSGDTLAGIVASLLAQGYDPETAGCCGMVLHAQAALAAEKERGQSALLACDVAEALGSVLRGMGL